MAISLQSNLRRGKGKHPATGISFIVLKTLLLMVVALFNSASEVVGQRAITRSLQPPPTGSPSGSSASGGASGSHASGSLFGSSAGSLSGDSDLLPVLTKTQAGQADAQLNPEAIRALLAAVEEKQKAANEKLRIYSYIIKRTEHQLNEQGEGTKYRVHEYRVFPRRWRLAVTAMLSENGQALSPEKLAKEKAQANKEWQKHKKDREKEPPKTAPWFDGLDFVVLPPERLDERDVVVFSFTPRAGYPRPKDLKSTLMPDLKGQIWIDPTAKMILKFQAELTRERRPGGLSGLLSALKPGTAITIENMQLANGLWAVKRVEVSSIFKGPGFLMLPHTERFRYVDEMSDYREFDPEATDLFGKLETSKQ